MHSNHMQQRLVDLGMSPREVKLYLALLDVPEMTAADLQRLTQVPRTKIYETLNQMVSRGLCIERLEGRRKFFTAVSPSEVLEINKQRWASEWDKRISEAEHVFNELDQRYQHNSDQIHSLDFIEVLRNPEQIHLRFMQLATAVKEEVLAFMRPPFASANPRLLAEQEQAMQDAFSRGVRARGIYQIDTHTEDWLLPHLRKSQSLGEEIRIIDSLPVKQFVFDRETVFVALPTDQQSAQGAMVMLMIQDRGYGMAGAELFEQIWSRSRPVKGIDVPLTAEGQKEANT